MSFLRKAIPSDVLLWTHSSIVGWHRPIRRVWSTTRHGACNSSPADSRWAVGLAVEELMRHRSSRLPMPILASIAATRGMLGAGLGLLLASRLSDKKRRKVGLALVGVGIATTIPLASIVFSRYR